MSWAKREIWPSWKPAEIRVRILKKTIESAANPYIKHLRTLAGRHGREKNGEFLVEGLRFAEEALKSAPVRTVVYTDQITETERGRRLLATAQEAGADICQVSAAVFGSMADTDSPQGVLAVVERRQWDWASILQPNGVPLVLVIDQLRDPGNLGTIIRTAEAAGVTGLVVLKGTVDLYNPKVLRATMGSIFRLPILTEVEPVELARLLEAGLELVVSGLETDCRYDQVDYTRPLALVVGNEANGCQDFLLAMAGRVVKIPLAGLAESLNVGVAAGVLLFEAARQRRP